MSENYIDDLIALLDKYVEAKFEQSCWADHWSHQETDEKANVARSNLRDYLLAISIQNKSKD